MRLEIPLSEELADELLGFWGRVFGYTPDLPRGALIGEESEHNRNVLYLNRRDGAVAGTCLTTTSVALPGLGGFGEVATEPGLRRSGIATALCGQAVEEFRGDRGEALFLGTGNPGAIRVYHRLGWRTMAGADVMANISSGESPESFLVEYFREQAPTAVRRASAAERVAMIPLIVTPHDWQVLDANAQRHIYSTRYATQSSCNGLFPRYESVREGGKGEWFAAHTEDGRVVGLSTARLDGGGGCRVDGFAHQRHTNSWPELMSAAVEWAGQRGAARCRAVISIEDEDKQAAFEGIGFIRVGPSTPFEISGRQLRSVVMDRPAD